MEWWKGAALTVAGVTALSWSVHLWNEGYRRVRLPSADGVC